MTVGPRDEDALAWITAACVVWWLFVSAVVVNIRRFVGAKTRVTIAVSDANLTRIVAT
jgi:hypothetical protein